MSILPIWLVSKLFIENKLLFGLESLFQQRSAVGVSIRHFIFLLQGRMIRVATDIFRNQSFIWRRKPTSSFKIANLKGVRCKIIFLCKRITESNAVWDSSVHMSRKEITRKDTSGYAFARNQSFCRIVSYQFLRRLAQYAKQCVLNPWKLLYSSVKGGI